MLEHTFPWLQRKYDQALKERWDKSSSQVIEGYKSLLLFVDSAFNKGKNFNNILPSSYEETIKTENTEDHAKYVSGQWWKETTKNAKESFKD